MAFNRGDYYSQSDLVKMYRGKLYLSEIKNLISTHEIPVIERPIEIGYDHGSNFKVSAKYILKADWHRAFEKLTVEF